MSQQHKHAPHKEHKADGTLDQTAIQMNVQSYLDAMKAGQVEILAIGDPIPVPGMTGVFAKTFIVRE